jgi:hypothetical protein
MRYLIYIGGRHVMATNDNHDPEFGLVENIVGLARRWAVVEYDRLGPILRLGPYLQIDHARAKMDDLRELRRLEHELSHAKRKRRSRR